MPGASAAVALQGPIAVGLAALATASFLRASPGAGSVLDPLLLSSW